MAYPHLPLRYTPICGRLTVVTRRLAGAPPTEAPAEGSDQGLVNLELGTLKGSGGALQPHLLGGWGACGVTFKVQVGALRGPLWLDAWRWFGPGSK